MRTIPYAIAVGCALAWSLLAAFRGSLTFAIIFVGWGVLALAMKPGEEEQA